MRATEELAAPVVLNAVRCVLVWTMKEQLIKAKAVKAQGLNEKKAPQRNNRRTKKAPVRESGAVAPPQGCRVELSGEGAPIARLASIWAMEGTLDASVKTALV